MQIIGTRLFKLYPADETQKYWLVQDCDELDASSLPETLSVYDDDGVLVVRLDLSQFSFSIDIGSKDGWLVTNGPA